MRSTDGPRVSRQAASARACVDAHRSCEWEPPFNVDPERLGSKIASRKQASFQHVRSPTEIPAVRHVCARAPRRTGSRRRSRGLAVASLFRFPAGHRSCNDVHDSIDPPTHPDLVIGVAIFSLATAVSSWWVPDPQTWVGLSKSATLGACHEGHTVYWSCTEQTPRWYKCHQILPSSFASTRAGPSCQ